MQTDSSSSSQHQTSIREVPDVQDVKRLKINPEAPPHQYPQNTYRFRKAQAIIANFRDYHPTVHDTLSVREGSEHDVENLKRTFESMRCIDVEEPWVTDDKLIDFIGNLQKVADEGFNGYDCFILVVMAHGAQGGVIRGLNDEDILIKDIWGLFTADKCKSLANKPKFFFFQACRGDALGKGVHADDESPIIHVCEPEFISIPTQADILLVFSTFEGTSSLRATVGTPFIQDLCDVLSEDNAKEKHLKEPILNLMTYLCHDTSSRNYIEDMDVIRSLECKCDETDLRKQMPTFLSTLRKLFYFRIKCN